MRRRPETQRWGEAGEIRSDVAKTNHPFGNALYDLYILYLLWVVIWGMVDYRFAHIKSDHVRHSYRTWMDLVPLKLIAHGHHMMPRCCLQWFMQLVRSHLSLFNFHKQKKRKVSLELRRMYENGAVHYYGVIYVQFSKDSWREIFLKLVSLCDRLQHFPMALLQIRGYCPPRAAAKHRHFSLCQGETKEMSFDRESVSAAHEVYLYERLSGILYHVVVCMPLLSFASACRKTPLVGSMCLRSQGIVTAIWNSWNVGATLHFNSGCPELLSQSVEQTGIANSPGFFVYMDWFIDSLIDWLTDGLIDGLIDWLIG